MKLFFLISILFVGCILLSCNNEKLNDIDDIDSRIKNLFRTPKAIENPQNDDEYFFNYRLANFAPSTEPFIEETFGSTLRFEEIGFWKHTSYTSHVVGFTTNLPSISIVEYGETADYGKTTVQSESYFYQHLHYIKGLESGKTYHYRYAVQGYDGAIIISGDHTFTTQQFTDDIIRIPDDMEGDAPYTLTQGNAKYVLTRDMTVQTLAINIQTNDVELDLDGHTIIYDDGPPEVLGSSWNDYAYNKRATFGIRAGLWNFVNFKILNGVIKQGRNGGTGFIGIGFNPLFLSHMGNTYNEVAGITVDYYGNSVAGMVTSDGHIHHNVLYDRGSVIDNRHMAIRAMSVGQKPENDVSFNSLRRFRQRGIDNNGKTDHNELYSDSFDTNSFALGGGDNAQATNNKIFGMGYNPIGVGWGNNLQVKNNFIYLWAFAPTQRSEEYGRKSAVSGMRVTNYDNSVYENMLFEGNVIVLKATDHATMARGIWTTNGIQDRNILYRHNTVKVEAMPGNFTTDVPWNGDIYYNGDVNNAIAAVTVQGNGWTSEEIPDALIFEDNRFISNVNHIIIGEGYGISSGVRFYRTTLEKIDHDNDHFFAPVRIGFWYWNTLENRMIDTKLVGITEEEMTPHFYGGTGKMEMRYGTTKTLTVKNTNGTPIANKNFTLTTIPDDNYTQTLKTSGNGTVSFDLLTVRYFKYGNSQEHNGVPGVPSQTDYEQYVFKFDGYKPLTVSLEQLKDLNELKIEN
ncbi:MAG: hypothetical protein LBS69_00040 [Prevotellaceae bacterium]|jgi:hypothetical protein|nr:hypothetical protein [Prevotellaceae bacterium]